MNKRPGRTEGRTGNFKGLANLGAQLKAGLLDRAIQLAGQGDYLESVAAFEQSGAIAGDQKSGAADLAYALYRRALNWLADSDVRGAIRDLETARRFPNLPHRLRSRLQERLTAIQCEPAADLRKLDAAIADRFERRASEVDLRGEFLEKYGLSQAKREQTVDGVGGISAVGVYRWVGDINRNERWSRLIREFKSGDKGLPALFGRILAEHVRATSMCREWVREVDYIVPVPAAASRTAERGADAVASAGEHLGTRLGIPVRNDFLRRRENAERSREVGKMALAAQYSFNRKKEQQIEGRVVLLLDDVMTRGHTAAACASRLKGHGCAKVFLLVLALAESSLQSSRYSPAAN